MNAQWNINRVHYLYVLDNDKYTVAGFKKSFVAANSLLKRFNCAVVFMLVGHENMWGVRGERCSENIFWNQSQTVWGVSYHIYLNRAEWGKLRPYFVRSKLRGIKAFSVDCISCFSSLFSTFPGCLRCVLVVFYLCILTFH